LGNQKKVSGKITNKATAVTFKDAVVRVTYFSKTKTALGSKDYIIYELFPPNTIKKFELKIDNFKNVNSIDLNVVKAFVN